MNAPAGRMGSVKHFLDLTDFDAAALNGLIADARRRKAAREGLARGETDADKPLAGKMLALIFDKPSTRTRISFDVGMQQLGGSTIMLTGAEMQLGRGETMADTARVLSRYVDAIMIRTLDQDMLHELAENSAVPVINGMTKASHPCQVLADVMTFEEKKGPIRGRTVAWTGDSNNVQTSWVHAAAKLSFTLRIATPPELAPRETLRRWAEAAGAKVQFLEDPEAAVAGADCIVTDTWVSMGDEDTTNRRHNLLKPYQVNERLLARAAKDAIFMHCLPAHRGEEVTDEVMDGPHSVVFDEAENRLHAQKAILLWALSK
jgi:ornithine carbamoyltransferase